MRFTTGISVLALLCMSGVTETASADAMFRGNPQHTGVYAGAGVPKFTKVKWASTPGVR